MSQVKKKNSVQKQTTSGKTNDYCGTDEIQFCHFCYRPQNKTKISYNVCTWCKPLNSSSYNTTSHMWLGILATSVTLMRILRHSPMLWICCVSFNFQQRHNILLSRTSLTNQEEITTEEAFWMKVHSSSSTTTTSCSSSGGGGVAGFGYPRCTLSTPSTTLPSASLHAWARRLWS